MQQIFLKALILLMLSNISHFVSAYAGPVSYEGGWALMTYNQNDMADWQISYSVTSRWSLGVDYYRDAMATKERQYWIGRTSFLLKRWNELDSQANVYLYGGTGFGKENQMFRPAYFGGGEADFETRRIYVQARTYTVKAPDFVDSTLYQLRFGLAPYVASFESLHSWVIFQAQYFPSASNEKLKVGPIFRFFYQNILWELGATARGTWMLNSMIHF